MARLREMIEEARRWRAEHAAAKRYVDAAAAAIREKALTDALRAVIEDR